MVTSQTNIIQDYLDKSIKCNDQLIYTYMLVMKKP